eukprot:scaffold4829_cov129-Cylindrotheca_fusiformis.AAC.11
MDLPNDENEENSSLLRIEARAQVAEKWKSRRRQHPKKQRKKTNEKSAIRLECPAICSAIRRSWDDAIRAVAPVRHHRQRKQRISAFPSVLSILQERALKDQMEVFGLSLLPADYDFQKAIHDMSQSRSRVFLLLDLATIVQTHVEWRKRLPSKVRMVYSTKHNAHSKLLKVLGRLGVGFKVGTKFDLEACRQSCNDLQLWDDSSCIAKPNSFYRRFVLDTASASTSTPPLIVDSPEEVQRLDKALRSMSQRRQQELPKLRFILKLSLNEEPQPLILETARVAQSHNHHLVGFSLEFPESNTDLPDYFSLLSKALACYKEDLQSALPELHLTNPNVSVDQSIVDWLSEHSKALRLVTFDVSHLLVSNAGAICARIIGVKQNEAGKIHYYIDDGCYGSLSNHSKNTVPLPLKAGDVHTERESEDLEQLTATVWGPTCDGLDKVCVGKLPKLCRDDWLVFGNTGFCHVGTAFNGFSPPDVVYCVLGGLLYPSNNNQFT